MTEGTVQHRSRLRLTIACLFGLSSGVAACLGPPSPGGAADTPPPLPADTRAGRVSAYGHVDVEPGLRKLAPLHPGRVEAVEARDGQSVKAGAVLLRLDERDQVLRRREAGAGLAAARAGLAAAKRLPDQHRARLDAQRHAVAAAEARASEASHAHELLRLLERTQFTNSHQVAGGKARWDGLRAAAAAEAARLTELERLDPADEVARAEAGVAAAEAAHDQARRAVEHCRLLAPADGVVLRVLVSPGDVIGLTAGQPAVLFCPDGPRVVRAEIDQEFAARVAEGQVAELIDDATGEPLGTGRVTRLAGWFGRRRTPLQDPARGHDTPALECVIELSANARVRIGQGLRVWIRTDP